MVTNVETLRLHKQILAAMDNERTHWFPHWRVLSDNYLPRRYPWLMTQQEVKTANRQNRKLLDSTSTKAIRVLASGMMNGITSPARPWFSLRLAGSELTELSHEAKIYLEEVERIILLILAESNFYNSIAILYLEWVTFGTASMAIYEDFDDVIRCYNFSLGEFYLTQDETQRINRHGRRFSRNIEQLAKEFGEENLCSTSRDAFKQGGSKLLTERQVAHLIERNNKDDGLLDQDVKWREVYWEIGAEAGKYLAVRPLEEQNFVTPRWELQGNDSYGVSAAMDALADVLQLQKMHLERAQALSKKVRPPLIVDQQLRNRPKAFSAGGLTYAATQNSNFGAKAAYDVNVPFQEISLDIQDLRNSIKETLFNQLFNMISNLETVRSATEIDARREEKLVHLGPVLDRFQNEGLDPILKRVFGVAQRKGLLPEPPQDIIDADLEVQYVSVLSDAQRSVGTVSIERFFQFTGELAGVYPEAREIANVDELIRQYAEGIGIKPKGLKSREETAANLAAQQQQQQLAQTAAIGKDLAQGAKVLSDADVGGGQNALQAALG